MEGVIAQTLLSFAKGTGPDLEIQLRALQPLDQLLTARNDTKRRRIFQKGVPLDNYAPWTWWVTKLTGYGIGVDTDTVRRYMEAAQVIPIEDDDEDEAPNSADAGRSARLEEENRKLAADNETLRRANRRLRAKLVTHRSQGVNELDEIIFRGSNHRFFPILGGMAMAARSLVAHISARRFGLAANQDVDKDTVCKWQIIFTSSIQAARKAWYQDRQSTLLKLDPERALEINDTSSSSSIEVKYRFVIHVHRGDATNTTKFKMKLHTEQTVSVYFEITVGKDTKWSDVQASRQTGEGEADLLEERYGSAEGAYAMYATQIGSIGCPHWDRDEDARRRAQDLADSCCIVASVTHMMGTDSGGNEAACKRSQQDATAEDMATFSMGGACFTSVPSHV